MHVGAVIAVTDLVRARAFYEHALGMSGEETPGGWLLRGDQDSVIYLLPGIADAGSASWPVASFLVADVRETVRILRSRGVGFLDQSELPFDLDADGISVTDQMQVAWFRDPDGSVLTVFSRAGETMASPSA